MAGSKGTRLLTLLAPIVLWQGAVSGGVVSPSVLPPPAIIAQRTVRLLGEPAFLEHLFSSVRRTVIAAGVAAVLGVPVGFAMAANRRIRNTLSPVISAIFALPVIALFPLLILILGSNEAAIVFTAAVGSFILLVWNARNGADAIDPAYLEVAADQGATSRVALLREVWLPGSLPLVLVGLRLGLSMSLLIVTGVEFVAGNRGLGYVLWISWQTGLEPKMYATLVVIGIVGGLIAVGLARLRRRVIPWDRANSRTILGP
jgi:NitT/TauT family transport system permease protein